MGVATVKTPPCQGDSRHDHHYECQHLHLDLSNSSPHHRIHCGVAPQLLVFSHGLEGLSLIWQVILNQSQTIFFFPLTRKIADCEKNWIQIGRGCGPSAQPTTITVDMEIIILYRLIQCLTNLRHRSSRVTKKIVSRTFSKHSCDQHTTHSL